MKILFMNIFFLNSVFLHVFLNVKHSYGYMDNDLMKNILVTILPIQEYILINIFLLWSSTFHIHLSISPAFCPSSS